MMSCLMQLLLMCFLPITTCSHAVGHLGMVMVAEAKHGHVNFDSWDILRNGITRAVENLPDENYSFQITGWLCITLKGKMLHVQ